MSNLSQLILAFGDNRIPTRDEMVQLTSILFTLTDSECEELLARQDVPMFIKQHIRIIQKGGKNASDMLMSLRDWLWDKASQPVEIRGTLPEWMKMSEK